MRKVEIQAELAKKGDTIQHDGQAVKVTAVDWYRPTRTDITVKLEGGAELVLHRNDGTPEGDAATVTRLVRDGQKPTPAQAKMLAELLAAGATSPETAADWSVVSSSHDVSANARRCGWIGKGARDGRSAHYLTAEGARLAAPALERAEAKAAEAPTAKPVRTTCPNIEEGNVVRLANRFKGFAGGAGWFTVSRVEVLRGTKANPGGYVFHGGQGADATVYAAGHVFAASSTLEIQPETLTAGQRAKLRAEATRNAGTDQGKRLAATLAALDAAELNAAPAPAAEPVQEPAALEPAEVAEDTAPAAESNEEAPAAPAAPSAKGKRVRRPSKAQAPILEEIARLGGQAVPRHKLTTVTRADSLLAIESAGWVLVSRPDHHAHGVGTLLATGQGCTYTLTTEGWYAIDRMPPVERELGVEVAFEPIAPRGAVDLGEYTLPTDFTVADILAAAPADEAPAAALEPAEPVQEPAAEAAPAPYKPAKIRLTLSDYGQRVEAYDRATHADGAREVGKAWKGKQSRDGFTGWRVEVGDTSAFADNKDEAKRLLRMWAGPIVANIAAGEARRAEQAARAALEAASAAGWEIAPGERVTIAGVAGVFEVVYHAGEGRFYGTTRVKQVEGGKLNTFYATAKLHRVEVAAPAPAE